jgi:hypothetical protein
MNKELKLVTADVKENTATTYKNNYMRLCDALGITDKRKTVKGVGLDKIEPILLNDELNANARAGMLTVVKKLFSSDDDKERVDEIDQKIRKHKREHQVNKNTELTETLPTYKEMLSALKKVEDPRKYLINWLFIHANTRNADVALIDVHRSIPSRPVDIEELDKERNHIVLVDGHAILIRNVYKTVKSYGQKKNRITSRTFIDKAREYLGDELDKPLLTTRTGGPIPPSSFGAYLKKHRLMGLTESAIMKIVMQNVADKGSYNMLRKVSQNRGTSISTLLQEYDVTNITEPSTELKGEVES